MPASHVTNSSFLVDDAEGSMTADDAAWIITNSFIIFTMQTGFGLLESGSVTRKNEVNIMVKNLVDIALGGLTYWAFGYGLSFGKGPLTTPFCGVGSFFLDNYDDEMGTVFTTFVFQLSFATTATTIVSGAMAERCSFTAYCIFSFFNTVVYCIPAGWLWGDHGFLRALGVIDVAGSCGVHLVGGVSALVSAAMLGPRHGRYDNGTEPLPLGSPTNALLGLFVLWWGWLSFNCGSMFGVTNHKWKFAARTSVITIVSSFGGGIVGMIFSYATKDHKFDVAVLINSILSSLVAVTAGCSLYHPWESIIIGSVSSFGTCVFMPLMDRMGVDDPVGAVAVHAVGGLWGMIAVGIFAEDDPRLWFTNGNSGLLKGGGGYLLGIQCLSCLCIAVWSASITFIILFTINRFIPIRMTLSQELLGADLLEHGVHHDVICDQNMLKLGEATFKLATIFSDCRSAPGTMRHASPAKALTNGVPSPTPLTLPLPQPPMSPSPSLPEDPHPSQNTGADSRKRSLNASVTSMPSVLEIVNQNGGGAGRPKTAWVYTPGT